MNSNNTLSDDYCLKICLQEAKKAFNIDEVPVGCVIVMNNQIIVKAHNLREKKQSVLAHAEIEAINKACKKTKTKFLDGATLYVTLEPCLMCLGAIMQARIKRVVYCANEPKFGAIESAGNVLEVYKTNHFLEIYKGPFEEEVKKLMKDFFALKRIEKNNKK